MSRACVLLATYAATAVTAAASIQPRDVDAFAGLRWQAADEFARLHPNATDADPKTRMKRELERSIHACVWPRPARKARRVASTRAT